MAAALLVPGITITAAALQAVDLAYGLRAGEEILRSGSIARVDGFTLPAAGQPWLNQQWGAQVLFALVFRAGGWFGLATLRTFLAIVISVIVYSVCLVHTGSRRSAAALTLAGSSFWIAGTVLRPQLLGLACFAAILTLTAWRDQHPRWIFAAPLVTALWANLHGSFVLGPAWLLLAALRDWRGRRGNPLTTAVAGLLAGVTTLLNPFGWRVWPYVVDLSTNPLIRKFVLEWRPPSLSPSDGPVFVVGLLYLTGGLVAVAAIVRLGTRPRWTTLLTAISMFVPGLLSVRGMYWWGIAAPVLLAEELRWPMPKEHASRRTAPLALLLAGVLVVLLTGLLARWVPYRSASPPPPALLSYAPVETTRALEGVLRPHEPFFNAQLWGSWFEYALPEHPVFADARIEVIPAEAWRDYLEISAAKPGWEESLARWGLRVIAARDDQQGPLISALEEAPDWMRIYQGEGGAVFVRRSSP